MQIFDPPTGKKSFPGYREPLRRAFQRRLVPEETLDILVASLINSTIKQYNSAFKRWWCFCQNSSKDPFEPDIHLILKYLNARYKQNASYGTLNAERSAINLLSTIDIGSDSTVIRFFKGVFKNRPTRPKYHAIWNTDKVEPLNTLDLKRLTYKLVCLLALATAHRVQTLSLIKISKILISEDKIIIDIVDQIKTSRVGAPQPSFILPFFNDRKTACVASVLLQYLDRTKELRQEEDYLFLTFKKTYHKATSQSISRWLKNCLTEAGVDRKYTAHSTRHAATSAVA